MITFNMSMSCFLSHVSRMNICVEILLDTLPKQYNKKIIIDDFNYEEVIKINLFHFSNQNEIFIFSILEDDSDELPIEEVYEDEIMKK